MNDSQDTFRDWAKQEGEARAQAAGLSTWIAALSGIGLGAWYLDHVRRERERRQRELEDMRWVDDGGPVIEYDVPTADQHTDRVGWQWQRRGQVHHPVLVTEELQLLRRIMRNILVSQSEGLPRASRAITRTKLIGEYYDRFGHLLPQEPVE